MDKKDVAAALIAGTITTTGVDADINKAVENNILPPKKSIEVVQSKPSKEIKKVNKEFQKDLKKSESSGNYSVVNTEGYMGAYQFW